jgi:hypothetical protein
MEHRIFDTDFGTFHRFLVDAGSVVFHVKAEDDGSAHVAIYDRDYALKVKGMTGRRAGKSHAAAAVRNKFGPGVIRRMMRAVMAASPTVDSWTYDSRDRSPGNPRRKHTRSFNHAVS